MSISNLTLTLEVVFTLGLVFKTAKQEKVRMEMFWESESTAVFKDPLYFSNKQHRH